MSRLPRVSVIMPAYNVARYVDDAMRSILSQRGVAFELLVADDASDDQTWARILAYRRDPRLRPWRFRVHRGAGAARNWLLARVRSPYVAMCDADDLLLEGHLLRGIRAFRQFPLAGVIYSDLWELPACGGARRLRRITGPSHAWDLLGEEHLWNPGTFVRRSVIRRIGGYASTLPFKEDFDLFLRLAEVARCEKSAGPPTYLYRRCRHSLSDQPTSRDARVTQAIVRRAIARRYGYRVPW